MESDHTDQICDISLTNTYQNKYFVAIGPIAPGLMYHHVGNRDGSLRTLHFQVGVPYVKQSQSKAKTKKKKETQPSLLTCLGNKQTNKHLGEGGGVLARKTSLSFLVRVWTGKIGVLPRYQKGQSFFLFSLVCTSAVGDQDTDCCEYQLLYRPTYFYFRGMDRLCLLFARVYLSLIFCYCRKTKKSRVINSLTSGPRSCGGTRRRRRAGLGVRMVRCGAVR